MTKAFNNIENLTEKELSCVHQARKYYIILLRHIADFNSVNSLNDNRLLIISVIRFYEKFKTVPKKPEFNIFHGHFGIAK